MSCDSHEGGQSVPACVTHSKRPHGINKLFQRRCFSFHFSLSFVFIRLTPTLFHPCALYFILPQRHSDCLRFTKLIKTLIFFKANCLFLLDVAGEVCQTFTQSKVWTKSCKLMLYDENRLDNTRHIDVLH